MSPMWLSTHRGLQPHNREGSEEAESSKPPLPTPSSSIVDAKCHYNDISMTQDYAAPELEENKKSFRKKFGSPTSRFCLPGLSLYIIFIVLAMTVAAALILGLVLGVRHIHGRVHESALTVDLGYSSYTGVDDDEGVIKWLGIRYAAPPVGKLRFRAPVDPEVDSNTYLANKIALPCHSTPSNSLNLNSSEDCLFLDVYAPSSRSRLHPVYVFIQGGGLNDLANLNLDGSKLVRAGDYDIVVITFNYRVGPWGFLASKEIRDDGDLNAGLLDQRKVLKWVQEHIRKFGGDPNHVTLGGSSAGAGSVALHLTAYGGRNDDLFHAVAAGSPSLGAKLTVEGSQYQYDTLVERVNCNNNTDTLQCLRNIDIKILAENNQNIRNPNGGGGYPLFPYSNVIDGNFTTDNVYSLFSQGNFVKVPVIFGDDTNEGTIFTPATINSLADMNNFLKDNLPKLNQTQLDQIDNFYPKADQYPKKGEYWKSAANVYGDIRYICPGIYINTQFSLHGVSENWNFRWDVLERENAASGLGVTHTADLSSIWGSSNPPESALIPTIQGYWTSFIRSYDPNKYKIDESPVWESFSFDHLQRLHLTSLNNVSMENIQDDQKKKCDYFSEQSRSLSM